MPLPSPPPPPPPPPLSSHSSTGSAIPLVPLGSAPPSVSDPAPIQQPQPLPTTTTSPAPTPSPRPGRRRPSRHVQWNERVEAHVAIPVHEEEENALDTDSTDNDEATTAAARAAAQNRRRGSTASALTKATAGEAENDDDRLEEHVDEADDPFSSRYRVDDVPISLGGGVGENGALEGLVSPFANQLDVWVDPLERDGLPALAAAAIAAADGGASGEDAPPVDLEKAAKEEMEHKAQGLVQGSAGGFGLWEGLRKRRNSIRQLMIDEKGDDEKDLAARVEQEILAEQQGAPLGGEGATGLAGPGGPGILAALMALQQEEAALAAHSQSNTPLSSTAPTPSTSAPNSPHLTPPGLLQPFEDGYSSAEDSDDAAERERFLERRRLKRASKNAFHSASTSAAQASKSAARAAFRAATGGGFRLASGSGSGSGGERGRALAASSRSGSTSTLSALCEEEAEHSRSRSVSRSRASSPTNSSAGPSPALRPASVSSTVSLLSPTSPTLPTHHQSPSSASLPRSTTLSKHHRSHSTNALSRLISSSSRSSLSPPVSPTSPVQPGVFVPHRAKVTSELSKRVRKLGDRLGLELESERTRPAAARSSAGVFGGLVMGTAALAAPATPAGSSLAPLPTRPGYTLSRYSAPDINAARSGSPTSPVDSKPPSLLNPSPRRTLSPPPLSRANSGEQQQSGASSPRSPGQRSFDSDSRVASSRKSLSEMVREEEEKDREQLEQQKSGTSSGAGSAVIPASAASSRAGTPPALGASVPGEAAFKGKKKKAVFSLQLNDLPSPTEDDYRKRSPPSRRPSLSISTTGLTPGPSAADRSQPSPRPRTSPSPTSASGTFRFFASGPFTPRSPATHSPVAEYFSLPGSGAGMEKEKERLARKIREEEEKEAREREKDLREWQKEKKRRRKQRAKELKERRVFITAHVAAILERQQFILKLARAFMMFGAPSHRLEAQIQATARVLELPHCAAMYLPNCMLINFADPATCTSDIKFLKQAGGLDFGKLKTTYFIYNKVIRDKIAVTDASARLDALMVAPNKYKLWQHVVLGGLAGAFIAPSAFYASFIDCLMTVPLGGLLVIVQVYLAKNDMYSSLFEIVVCTINAVFAGLLSYTNYFCFYSLAASSIVLVLPGFIVLCAALEIANRSIVSGAVRITYAALYALFLGFGLSAGSEIYTMGGRHELAGGGDYTCGYLRGADAPWYMSTIPRWWYFLTIPGFLFCMAIKHGQPVFRRDTLAMIAIGCCGFSTNYFSGLYVFINQPAITSMIGAFVVGVLGNTWARLTRESAFVVMIVGLFVQLPSGLANGGLISFAQNATRRTGNNFGAAIAAAGGLIRVTVGITVGLFAAAALMNLVSRRGRRRGANLSTF